MKKINFPEKSLSVGLNMTLFVYNSVCEDEHTFFFVLKTAENSCGLKTFVCILSTKEKNNRKLGKLTGVFFSVRRWLRENRENVENGNFLIAFSYLSVFRHASESN